MAGFSNPHSHHLPAFLLRLRELGVTDVQLLKALEKTDRRLYIPDLAKDEMWEDRDHSIGYGQSAGVLSLVAIVVDALKLQRQDKVLDIGVGCGYQTAVLARLSRRVYGVERVRPLIRQAEKNLERDGILNATLYSGDGHAGWPMQAPFNAIVLTAACETVPPVLFDQLADGGRLVAPMDEGHGEEAITLFHKNGTEISSKTIGRGEFPPLVPGRVSDD